jgi:hypothetical protein
MMMMMRLVAPVVAFDWRRPLLISLCVRTTNSFFFVPIDVKKAVGR